MKAGESCAFSHVATDQAAIDQRDISDVAATRVATRTATDHLRRSQSRLLEQEHASSHLSPS